MLNFCTQIFEISRKFCKIVRSCGGANQFRVRLGDALVALRTLPCVFECFRDTQPDAGVAQTSQNQPEPSKTQTSQKFLFWRTLYVHDLHKEVCFHWFSLFPVGFPGFHHGFSQIRQFSSKLSTFQLKLLSKFWSKIILSKTNNIFEWTVLEAQAEL